MQSSSVLRLDGLDANELVQRASTDDLSGLKHRFALAMSGPILLEGSAVDGQYFARNVSGQFDLFEESTGEGSLTTEYLESRALYLEKFMERNQQHTGDSFFDNFDRDFVDVATSTVFSTRTNNGFFASLVAPDASRLVFGDESANSGLAGGDAADQIFGGDGSDTLQGLGASDYLEGGKGNDVADRRIKGANV
jgi:Ca2+-binding RTX toxin-like protein